MSYTFEDFYRDFTLDNLQYLTVEERLQGLTIEDILQHVKLRDILDYVKKQVESQEEAGKDTKAQRLDEKKPPDVKPDDRTKA